MDKDVKKSFMEDIGSEARYMKWQLKNRIRNLPAPPPRHWTSPFKFQGTDIVEDIRTRHNFDGDLAGILAHNEGGLVQKWHQYIPLYDRYFSAFRNKPVRFLEIGVSQGGSLQMWRKYFGPDAIICGIDINPKCKKLDGEAGMVRIGSQDDPKFLRSVVEELGGLDVVLDDGSHMMKHQKASLRILFPLMSEGGIYMVEDLHCAYMRDYGGGTRASGNFFRFVRDVTDDMHGWYHPMLPKVPELKGFVSGIHVHDSIAVFEKNHVHPPVVSKVGTRNDI